MIWFNGMQLKANYIHNYIVQCISRCIGWILACILLCKTIRQYVKCSISDVADIGIIVWHRNTRSNTLSYLNTYSMLRLYIIIHYTLNFKCIPSNIGNVFQYKLNSITRISRNRSFGGAYGIWSKGWSKGLWFDSAVCNYFSSLVGIYLRSPTVRVTEAWKIK